MRHPFRQFITHHSAIIAFLFLLASAARADLEKDLQAILKDKLLEKASVAVEVVQLGSAPTPDRVLFRHRADTPLIPASNLKLVTTAAALEGLGPNFRFQTLLVQKGEDLVLVGDGDPTFGDAELLKKVGWETTTVFQNWAQQLRKAELLAFRHVLVDDSIFDETFVHPNWPPDQEQARYVAQVAGMSLNLNCIDFFVRGNGTGNTPTYRTNPPTKYAPVSNTVVSGGDNAVWINRNRGSNDITLRGTCPNSGEVAASVTVHDPGLFAATVLAETLRSNGVHVEGKIARDRTVRAAVHSQTGNQKSQIDGRILAVHTTPIAQVLARANKDSINLYAESLAKRLGAAHSATGSWPAGASATGAFLRKLGVPDAEFKLDDGSGLSRENAVSANTITSVLRFHHRGPNRDAYLASLAVGGIDGTLDERFRPGTVAPDLKGRLFGKSGYIVGVSALSGYLKAKDGNWYTFCILMNNLPRGSNGRAKYLQDQIVKAIDANSMSKR
jgi:serine-type D-Ala-D-Ala carboxypeptidase/endopeptidase (penicillin-binding protein 4)